MRRFFLGIVMRLNTKNGLSGPLADFGFGFEVKGILAGTAIADSSLRSE